jgi:endonuclease G
VFIASAFVVFAVLAFIIFLSFSSRVQAVSTNVVISEFRVRGPNGGNDEFIELYNLSGAPVAIGGWNVRGSNNAAGVSIRATVTAGTTLQPGCHYLLTNAAASGYSGAIVGDQTYTVGITDDGGIALTLPDGTIVDAVGMSTGSAYKEGTVLPSLGATTASNLNRGYERKPGGAAGSGTDTDNNLADFQLITPSDPQNSSECSTPSPTPTPSPTATATPTPTPTPNPSPTPIPGSVVISQVYGGGGNTGATLKNDYVEIINHSATAVDLSNWSVQIASAGQANWQKTNLTNFVLQPGQYYLVQQSQGAGGTDNLPTPDAIGGGLVSSTSGKVALVSHQTLLTGNCPAGGGIVDFVGYGTETCAEGSPAATLTNTTAALRKNNGCFDSDNNAVDFASGAPSPRNSSSPTNSCTALFAIGSAQPSTVQMGNSTTLTVTVSPAQDPTSTGINVSADLSAIGGSATQAFTGVGNTFTFVATVPADNTSGPKSLPVTVTDAQARSAAATIFVTVQEPHVTISQIYGGGGNASATFTNDFVELFNPTDHTVDLTGWSLQYTSAAGDSWDFTSQPIGGFIEPGQYYLIALAGGATGAPLPAANINGDINMSATTGKVALVNNFDPLEGTCPLGNPSIVDFVGYGTGATCAETANAPAPSNTSAIFRANGGATDNDNNLDDFVAGTPSPRRTAPIVEIGPSVFRSDPRKNGINAPRDASITINFTEPVTAGGSFFNINCAVTGSHNDATVAGADKVYVITPNVNFQAGEQCTFTIFKDQIHDVDTDDSGPNDDTLLADFVATFTVATGTAPPYPPSVHLTFGNPNGATADLNQPNNYLMEKPEFALSYNRDKGGPNWVSWHLSDEWIGTLARVDTFRPDPAVPPAWYRVQATDFSNSGFDRGHMTPNADRDKETSIPINQATFLMSNMVAQSPDNNQGPWAALENFLRTLLPANELYIVSGPAGVGGTGSNGGVSTTIANGHVVVPSSTWKVVLVIPKGDNDISRVTAATRTIAVNMPNIQGIRNNDWHDYLTTVDAVEALTGYDFFANVPDAVENAIEAGIDGSNPPGTEGQAVTTAEDTSKSITLTAVSPIPSASFTFTIVTPPAHGQLTGTGANRSYQPDLNFNGSDSFTFQANDGSRDSNTSTVTITTTEVNDAPVATDDAASTDEDTNVEIAASNLTGNDSAGAVNENAQVLTVTSVSATADTHGTVSLSSGTITYSPDSNFNGAASFTYEVCDNGTTNGAPDSQCTTGTVNVTVNGVNDAPILNAIANQTVYVGDTLSFTASGSDIDLPPQTLTYSLTGVVPSGATINPATGAFSWTPTAAQGGHIYTLTLRVTDDGSPGKFAEQQFTVGVAYTWSNLLAPVLAGGTYKAGRTLPLKFQLTGASAGVTDAVIHLLIYKITDNVAGDPMDVESTSAASTGNLFRFENGYYVFNLSTSGLTAGTYQLQIDMGDGVTRTANISLK